jgi:hypothetical protein
VPGYKEKAEAFKSLGIDEIIVYCVNDGVSACGHTAGSLETWARAEPESLRSRAASRPPRRRR